MQPRKTFVALCTVYCLVYCHIWIALQRRTSQKIEDVPAMARSYYHLNVSNINDCSNRTKFILLWTDFFTDRTWEMDEGRTTFKRLHCPVTDCFLTNDRAMLSRSAAVLFHGPNMRDEPPPQGRHPEQKWIYMIMESPLAVVDVQYDVASWKGQFNWTMSYRLDSDVLVPYGEATRVNSRVGLKKDYLAIARSKTRLVAWMVSHCDTPSQREKYVRELQRYIPVDIYGKCGNYSCRRDYFQRDRGCQTVINDTYLFYLAFENAHCMDYVTEKLFRILPLDVVPIVRGSFQRYERQIPRKWYINTDDFSSPKELANYLINLQMHPEEYIKYFADKEHYRFTYHMGLKNVPTWCKLCQKLHDPEEPLSTYPDIRQWWSAEDCVYPSDIPYEIIPILVGISVAVIILATIITVSCFFCRCCAGYKKRQKRLQKAEQQQQQQQQQQSHDLPDIAVQAGGHHLSLGCDTSAGPLGSGQYLHHQPSCTASSSGCTHNEVLHCGCQWSPALQHSPITDLDSIMKQLYGENTELEPLSEFHGDNPPPYTEHDIHKFELPKIETKTLGRRFKENKEKTAVNESNTKVTRAISDPSQLCMKTFRPVMQMRLSSRLETDAKRDSGVLVEEGEGTAEATEPAIILENLQPQPVLRSPAFLGYASSQSSLEIDTSDIKVAIHSPAGFYS